MDKPTTEQLEAAATKQGIKVIKEFASLLQLVAQILEKESEAK